MNHWLGKEKWELIIKLKLTKRTLFSQCRKLSSGCKNANSTKICNVSSVKTIKPSLFKDAHGLSYQSWKMVRCFFGKWFNGDFNTEKISEFSQKYFSKFTSQKDGKTSRLSYIRLLCNLPKLVLILGVLKGNHFPGQTGRTMCCC